MQIVPFEKYPHLVPIKISAYVVIVDMGIIWQMFTLAREDREKADITVYTCGNFVIKIIHLIISRHQLVRKMIMVSNPYNLLYSIKDDEKDFLLLQNSTLSFVMFLQHLIKNDLFPVTCSVSKELIY